MTGINALKSVVERNKLSMGEFSTPHDELWIEAQRASIELEDLERRLALEEHLRENAETSYSVVYNMNTELKEQNSNLYAEISEMRDALATAQRNNIRNNGGGWRLGSIFDRKIDAVLSKYSEEEK